MVIGSIHVYLVFILASNLDKGRGLANNASILEDAYTIEVWERLVQLKNIYDLNNLFRLHENIKPSLRA
jgi:hypothetical protein